MTETGYQKNFSALYPESMYDSAGRSLKARKILAVLDDHYRGGLSDLSLLDVGCSTGIMTAQLALRFRTATGIDIDTGGVMHAQRNFGSERVCFLVQDAMATDFPDNSFDVVTCAHVYEHVPDAARLLREIRRVLKPGGICYFAAGNRFVLIEGHYKLPLLAAIPKPLAHLYLRLLGRGRHYYETHLSLWGLRRLVRGFEIIDYTPKVIRDPARYHMTDSIRPGSFLHLLARTTLPVLYPLCGTYIWLLRKPEIK